MITNEVAHATSDATSRHASAASQNALDDWGTDGGSAQPVQQPTEPLADAGMNKNAIREALNEQIRHEQSNAHAYLAVSIYFGQLDLHGFEAFMAQQADEERSHANKLIRYVNDRRGHVELRAIESPKANFTSPLDAARFVREMERKTTQRIERLYEQANHESDYALQVLLHWFIAEQVEEEKWAQDLMSLMERLSSQPAQLHVLDYQWGQRAKRD